MDKTTSVAEQGPAAGEMRQGAIIQLLVLEENAGDAILLERALQDGRLSVHMKRARTREGFLGLLDDFHPDLIIANYAVRSYDGLTALDDVRKKGIDVPYIIVLAGSIGQNAAVEMLKRGAADCILKNEMSRLVPAIVRALQGHEERVAQRKREEALRTSEKFKGLAASSQDAIIMIDERENVSYWNEAAERVFGYASDEMMGAGMVTLFASVGHAEAYRKELREFNKTGEAMHLRKPLTVMAMKKDGTEFLIELAISTLQLKGAWHAVSIVRDVTERKLAEDVLRRSERNLVRAQEIAHIGSWRWDIVDGRLVWSHGSHEAYRVFGLAEQQRTVTFETFLQAVHAEDRDRVKKTVDAALCGEVPYDLDHRIVLNDGSVRFVHEQAAVIRDDSGRVVGMEGTVHDITTRKAQEEMLHRQLENMTALSDIAISISSSLDVRVALSVLLDKLTALLQVDAADVLLLDQESLYLNYAAGRGFRNPEVVQSTHVRLGKGHAGQAAYERRPLIITNLSETLTKALKGEQFESYIAMPLIAQGKVKGVLEIFQRNMLKQTPEWMNFLGLLAEQAAIAIDNASMFDSLQRFSTELTLSYDATLEGWGRTLEFRDEDTMGHTQRVTELTLQLGRIMGMTDPELVQARRGALLHDIGKISIPDRILLKPGPLTLEELSIMKLHTVYAQELISGIPFLRPAIDIPYCHHEMWNGAGYPRGLKGEDIPFNARVFAVIDVADALISERHYRPAWPVEKTYQHIAGLRGVHFDPLVVDAFLGMKWAA
ncbi:MAG: HD domain-containing phosphohydrolase [Nitrospirota bacterium]